MANWVPRANDPTAQDWGFPGRADTEKRLAESAGGLETVDHVVPFQCMVSVWTTLASPLNVSPAAHTSLPARPLTLRR